MSNLLLRVEVDDGLFDSEAQVTFNSASGETISAVASRTFLHKDSHGRQVLRVRLLRATGSSYLVELPGDLYGATRDVLVSQDIVATAPAAE
ncbi:MAG: hypothetical protein F4Y50_05715 [Dehalococcoidia bacterium]|nr:hypothetical protein [Dehalococcoidia bacterium]